LSLIAGTRIGPYEISSALGAGGMGEVYRATDTVLKRQVALKVLPPEVAKDPELVARFQREAEVLASLNHPDNADLYGIESPTAFSRWSWSWLSAHAGGLPRRSSLSQIVGIPLRSAGSSTKERPSPAAAGEIASHEEELR